MDRAEVGMQVAEDSSTFSSSAPLVPSSVESGGGPRGGVSGGSDTKGKHRIMAEMKRLEQEAKFLEQELEELEKTEIASTACQELLLNVESIPDPLLPVTNGPVNPSWERWFEGPQDSRKCDCYGCWVL